jgi:hypothetical protein
VALGVAGAELSDALPEPLGVPRRLEEVDGLLERPVFVGRDQERGALLGDDLDRDLVVVDLLDQRKQPL